ncbi:MAG: amino acid adenylation domain-containing protein [Verrucomicrobiota bacterium]
MENDFLDLLLRFNPANDEPPAHSTVTKWLACGVECAGESPALEYRGSTVSHEALGKMSNQVARYLGSRGVKSGDRVGLCLDRSIEMVVAVVGILKAGAAYVPLDPDYPSERLAMMRQDARLCCLLAHSAHAERFEPAVEPLFIWEEIEAEVKKSSAEAVAVEVDPEDVAYVIFTSGSTGRPKGIAMPHRALSNLIEWQLQRRSFLPRARVLQYSSISFDVSFQEITTTIASGGTLFLIGNEERKDPRTLLAQLTEQRIERLFLPCVALRSMIEVALAADTFPHELKEVITAGEQLRVDKAVRMFFSRIQGASLDNQYGPSETHVISAHLLEGNPEAWPNLPAIGVPLANNSIYILNDMMHPVGVGEEGELYLAGRNLAHGYLHHEDATRKAFIPNPHEIPDRPILYKTGDLGAYNKDGSINFLGRKDHQVKIRGHRVELGEINVAAARFPGIAQCLTRVVVNPAGIAQLVVYYVVQKDAVVEQRAFRQHLSRALPSYMIPSFLIEIKEVPYTPSGKMDLKALPVPAMENSQCPGEEDGCRSGTEECLAAIWSDLLGLEGIPRKADFFELGGDSLQAVSLFLQIQKRFGRDLPLSTLTHAPTIAKLSRIIDDESDAPDMAGHRSLQLLQRGSDDVTPLFLIHGGAGNVLIFNEFASHLGPRQPVYGFQWSGWDGMRGENSIPEMARAYKKELLRFRPSGPYRIGGNCIGGMIAIELVKLLKADGLEVEGPLLVWDAPNLRSPTHCAKEPWGNPGAMAVFERMKEDLIDRATRSAGQVIHAAPASRTTGLIGFLKRIPGLHPFQLWIKALPKIIPIQLALWKKRPVPVDLRPTFCLRTMISAVKSYTSPGHDGDMLYFRSYSVMGRDFSLPGWWDDPFLGFGELCKGRFEAHVVGHGHNDVLSLPETGEIATAVFSKERNQK